MIGQTLSHFRITAKLGEGGMGEVYKAVDTRLDRTVAIKVLPESVATDPELKRRFEREARTVAALNHPHICALYDIGSHESVDFLVIEYLDGQTLAARLKRGALPLKEALEIAIQVADALDKAHRQGVVHRDLKPGNIMLTGAGAKLLDFGLAKLQAPAIPGANGFSAATTQSEPLTGRGTILGTLQYMAPEQLQGKEADSRSDLFAFGAVLYEMVSGRRAFEGNNQASLIAAILDADPEPMSTLQPLAPARLDRVVNKCLEKEPDDRWQSTHDLADELRWIAEEGTRPTTSGAEEIVGPGSWQAISRSIRRLLLAGMVILTGLVAALVGWWAAGRSGPVTRAVTRTSVTLPAGEQLVISGGAAALALSPDGRRLAYAIATEGGSRLSLRALDSFEQSFLPGTEGASHPFFSPDGEWVGFFADGLLQKVAVSGGLPLTICEAPGIHRGATWAADGTIIFTSQRSDDDPGLGLMRVSADRGEPQPLATADPEMDAGDHAWPSFLPGDTALLTTVSHGTGTSRIAVLSLESGKWHVIGPGSRARYVPPGYLVYFQARSGLTRERGGLEAVRFDRKRLRMTGSPASVIDSVYRAPNRGSPFFEVSRVGSIVYLSGGLDRSLVWVDRDGRSTPVTEDLGGFRFPRLSPDESQVVVSVDPRPSEIWIYDLERGTHFQLAEGGLLPQWTPDGGRVVFSTNEGFYWIPADLSVDAELLLARENPQYPTSWSPDGKYLAFNERRPATGWDIMVLSMEGEPSREVVLATPATESFGSFSPDGRWLAYISNQSGRYEVYVRPFQTSGSTVQISTTGGRSPVWSVDGSELFYRNGPAVMGVTVETEPIFRPGPPEILFEGPYSTTSADYDVAADGRFVMVVPDPDAAGDRLRLVLDWAEELEERVPVP